MEFRFRKYIAPEDYHQTWKDGGMRKHPAFKTDSNGMYSNPTTGYNAATGSGGLWSNASGGWDGAIVLSAKMTAREFQDYFKRTWIEEDGIDVYIDGARKHKAAKNTIEMIMSGEESAVRSRFDGIIDDLNVWGVFEYYDTYNKGLKRLILDKVNVVNDLNRHGRRYIHFRLECTNVLGYDNRSFNPTLGSN